MADGSCRWRQTGSEVKVIALRVPPDLAPRQLSVAFEPFALRIAHAASGEVYLEVCMIYRPLPSVLGHARGAIRSRSLGMLWAP